MTIENIDVSKALEKVRGLLREETNVSPTFRASIELLMLVVSILVGRVGRNSRNSSIPPSQDPHREKKTKSKGDRRKPGGQKGHPGTTLQKIRNDRMGLLPLYRGYLVHDHMKSYYRYENITHCLCNAHHLRELERAWEEDHQTWAKSLQDLLIEMNNVVHDAGGVLSVKNQIEYQERYRDILKRGDDECLRPPPKEPGKRGCQKKSKSRNLLERLRDFEKDALRFMSVAIVPFTNNQAENDLRMTKVQQKISGCFRSMEGARIFCRIRSFLATCRKNNVSPTDALRGLFQAKFPAFMQ